MNGQAGRIVVGFDGSDHSVAALAWAAEEAGHRRLPLTVMHVADYQDRGRTPTALWPQLHDEAQKVAIAGMERARRISGSSDITAVARVGPVHATLVEASREAALLVVGTRGHGDLAGTLLGSTAFSVCAQASCPVVVVRGDSQHPCGPERPVVVGAGSLPSRAAVRYAADAAARTGAPLKVITAYRSTAAQTWASAHVYSQENAEDPTFENAQRQRAQRIATSAAELARRLHPELDVHEHVVEGPVSAVLCAAAARCGLLVLGTRGHGGFAGLMLGSISHGAIHSGPCPVAVLRTVAVENRISEPALTPSMDPAPVVG